MNEAGRSAPRSHYSPRADSPDTLVETSASALPSELLKLKARLAPLAQVEEALLRRLSPPGTYDNEGTCLPAPGSMRSGKVLQEITVHSNSQWKGAFGKLVNNVRTSLDSTMSSDSSGDPNDPAVILEGCAEDMVKLWMDPTVQALLKAHKIRLEDRGGL